MEACEVINGTATDNGGAIFLSEATLLTERLLFERNSATSKGGAVYVKKANLNMTATEMRLNEAGEGGGALYVTESSVSMERCKLNRNSVPTIGEGPTATSYGGGALYLYGDAFLISINVVRVLISSCIISRERC